MIEDPICEQNITWEFNKFMNKCILYIRMNKNDNDFAFSFLLHFAIHSTNLGMIWQMCFWRKAHVKDPIHKLEQKGWGQINDEKIKKLKRN